MNKIIACRLHIQSNVNSNKKNSMAKYKKVGFASNNDTQQHKIKQGSEIFTCQTLVKVI